VYKPNIFLFNLEVFKTPLNNDIWETIIKTKLEKKDPFIFYNFNVKIFYKNLLKGYVGYYWFPQRNDIFNENYEENFTSFLDRMSRDEVYYIKPHDESKDSEGSTYSGMKLESEASSCNFITFPDYFS